VCRQDDSEDRSVGGVHGYAWTIIIDQGVQQALWTA